MTHYIDLNEATQAGIISLEQAKQLEKIGHKVTKSFQADDEQDKLDNASEPFRLIGGFNDIFVTIGIILFLTGTYVSLTVIYNSSDITHYSIIAVLVWGMAEYISRVKRMKLPSTVLAVSFMSSISIILGILLNRYYNYDMPEDPIQALVFFDQMQISGLIFFAIISGISTIYLWRFRVPIQAAFIALSMTGIISIFYSELLLDRFTSGAIQINDMADLINFLQQILLVTLFCGVCIFTVGVYLDFKDRDRRTTLSDSAFWLHLLSAPMLVHPLFMMAKGEDMLIVDLEPSLVAKAGMFIMVFVIVLISLVIDRRALLIPTLAYLGSVVIYQLIDDASSTTGIPNLALILLIVGTLVIILGVGWQTIRGAVIRRLLPVSWLASLPPLK